MNDVAEHILRHSDYLKPDRYSVADPRVSVSYEQSNNKSRTIHQGTF